MKYEFYFQKIFIFVKKNLDSLIIKGSLSGLLIQLGFLFLSFVLATILARFLGPNGYGSYSNAMAWISIFSTFSTFGFASLIVREVSIGRRKNDWNTIRGLIKFSNIITFSLSIFFIFVIILISNKLFISQEKIVMKNSLILASFLIPIYSLSNIRQAAIRGFENITLALLPDLILRPLILLFFIIALIFFPKSQLNPTITISLSIVSALISLLIGDYWLRRIFPKELPIENPIYKINQWISSAFPLFLYSGFQLLLTQTPIIFLGLMLNSNEVGLYSATTRYSSLLGFFPMTLSYILGPVIAKLYFEGEKIKLQNILTISVQIAFFISFFIGLFFMIESELLLSIFGNEYIKASNILSILIIGNLFDVAFGNSPLLLSMCGFEKKVAKVFTISTILNMLLNFLLMNLYNINGAAYAFTISLIFSRFILSIISKKELGLNPTIFNLKFLQLFKK